jgi:plasmid maintenance system antidote protein VapI
VYGLHTTSSCPAQNLAGKIRRPGLLATDKPVSPDLAVRLERAGVSTAQLWLSMQSAYDLWQAEHREQPLIERFARID